MWHFLCWDFIYSTVLFLKTRSSHLYGLQQNRTGPLSYFLMNGIRTRMTITLSQTLEGEGSAISTHPHTCMETGAPCESVEQQCGNFSIPLLELCSLHSEWMHRSLMQGTMAVATFVQTSVLLKAESTLLERIPQNLQSKSMAAQSRLSHTVFQCFW